MKGYFNHISFKYNKETSRTMKDFCNETKRLAQQQQRLKFLLSCRSYGLTPNHTKNTTTQVKQLFKCNTIQGKLKKIEHNFHKKLLNLEISQTNTNIKNIKRKLFHIRTAIEYTLTEEDNETFFKKQSDRTKHITKNVKEGQIAKLKTLREKYFKLYGLVFNENWFENKTDVNIPHECKWMLSLGKKFALPVDKKNFSPLHIIADVEQCIQAMDNNIDKEKDVARTKLANRVTSFKRNLKNTPREKFIITIFEKTKKFLKRHDNIIIIQADKGNKTVAMFKEEYETKMKNLLDDKQTYKTIRVDPTPRLQKANNLIVADLHKHDLINSWEKRRLFCSAATAPRIYGLPKIHKPNIPLRPIVSSVQVACYNLSKYVGQILKHIISEKYNVKNSRQVKEQLTNLKLDEKEVLVSFDVISLFTNIPIHTAIKNIMSKWDQIKEITNIPSSKFLKMLQFCLSDNNYFIYEDKIYNQIFGMPMGNPLSPTIADIVLDSLLDEALDELKSNNIHIKYLTKYVDDILAIINIDHKDAILSSLNKYHPKIQFTMELEQNKQLAYLDTKLQRYENKLRFDWYSKSTSSGRLMNYNATQPKYQIINTARNFISTVLNISDKVFHSKNTQKIYEILSSNSFPRKIIQELIFQTNKHLEHQQKKPPKDNTDCNAEKHFYSVKYIPGLTDSKCINDTIKTENICFAYKPHTTLSTIFSKTKTPIPKQQRSNVVYEVKCKGSNEEDCNLIYIGMTRRTLETRISEHQTDIEKKRESTGLSQHIMKSCHTPDFANVRILDTEKIEKKRLTIESLRIQQNIKYTMNLKEDTNNINASYRVAI